jgi:hypothetical protein
MHNRLYLIYVQYFPDISIIVNKVYGFLLLRYVLEIVLSRFLGDFRFLFCRFPLRVCGQRVILISLKGTHLPVIGLVGGHELEDSLDLIVCLLDKGRFEADVCLQVRVDPVWSAVLNGFVVGKCGIWSLRLAHYYL